jgi:hypothetical protein
VKDDRVYLSKPRASPARASPTRLPPPPLRGFKAKTASDLDGTMTTATQPLTDTEIVSLVHFIATLGPAP